MTWRSRVMVGSVLIAALVAPTPTQAGPAEPEWAPERVRVGTSVQGRPIWAYRVGDPEAERVVLLMGQMHGNEPAGRVTARWTWQGPQVHGVDMWVIPTMNPDGAAAGVRRNAHGVDLNRNWGYSWRPSAPGSTYYSGPTAWSEPETVAVRAFIRRIDPHWVVSLHQPLYAIDADTKSRVLRDRLAARLPMPLVDLTCNGTCHGTMTGWINHRTDGAAITVEYGPHPTRHFVRHRARRAIVAGLTGSYAG